MRIVNRAEFLAMPPGTVFAKYEPCVSESLEIKGPTLFPMNDYCYQQIAESIAADDCGQWGDLLEASRVSGISVAMDFDCLGRDGCYDDDQLFAVYEPADVHALIARLNQALNDSTTTQPIA